MTNVPLDLPRHLDLEQFISDEAHDLRSPFNQIVGFSKLLLNEMGVDYPPDLQKEDLGTIYRNAQRALLLMNSLIDIARLNRREKEISPEEIEIEAMLEQTLAYWRKLNAASDIQTEYQISVASSHLIVDEGMLRQILFGFIVVVSQFLDSQGQASITVAEEAGWSVFTVSSVGKKTQPFSRLDVEMQAYISRALVELQRGEIRLAEETDDGASIQFALPMA